MSCDRSCVFPGTPVYSINKTDHRDITGVKHHSPKPIKRHAQTFKFFGSKSFCSSSVSAVVSARPIFGESSEFSTKSKIQNKIIC